MSLMLPERSGASGNGSGGWSTVLAVAPVTSTGGRSGGDGPVLLEPGDRRSIALHCP